MRLASRAWPVLAALLAAGCGSNAASDRYAGLDEKTAQASAYEAFQQALAEPSSPLRARHMRLVGLRPDAAPDGHPAWLALFRSADDDTYRYCVWVTGAADQAGADLRPCSVRFDSEGDAKPA